MRKSAQLWGGTPGCSREQQRAPESGGEQLSEMGAIQQPMRAALAEEQASGKCARSATWRLERAIHHTHQSTGALSRGAYRPRFAAHCDRFRLSNAAPTSYEYTATALARLERTDCKYEYSVVRSWHSSSMSNYARDVEGIEYALG